MCRFLLYMGPDVSVSSLVTEPKHSLIHQSYHSEERAEPLNGDGAVTDANCHPLIIEELAFMHNGHVAGIDRLTRALRRRLSDAAYARLQDSTDIEHLADELDGPRASLLNLVATNCRVRTAFDSTDRGAIR